MESISGQHGLRSRPDSTENPSIHAQRNTKKGFERVARFCGIHLDVGLGAAEDEVRRLDHTVRRLEQPEPCSGRQVLHTMCSSRRNRHLP